MAAAKSPAKEIEKLREEIRRHEELYYVLDSPEIADAEYDSLVEKLQKLEQQYPDYNTGTSADVVGLQERKREQLLDVGQVQAGRRFVEDVGAAFLAHVGGQLEPLPLAAG